MPSALYNNAIMLKNEPRQMDEARRKESAIYLKDDETIASKKKKPHKQSFDYIWRTGLAGGMAGSAVGLQFF
jgi:solute carrier family 25 protein 16